MSDFLSVMVFVRTGGRMFKVMWLTVFRNTLLVVLEMRAVIRRFGWRATPITSTKNSLSLEPLLSGKRGISCNALLCCLSNLAKAGSSILSSCHQYPRKTPIFPLALFYC